MWETGCVMVGYKERHLTCGVTRNRKHLKPGGKVTNRGNLEEPWRKDGQGRRRNTKNRTWTADSSGREDRPKPRSITL